MFNYQDEMKSSSFHSDFGVDVMGKEPKNEKLKKNKRGKLKKQPAVKTTCISAEDFQIKLVTKYPKKQNHNIFGDKIIKILGKTQPPYNRYYVLWQDGQKVFVQRSYLYQNNRQLLFQFEMRNTFKSHIKRQNSIPTQSKTKKQSYAKPITIVID